MSKIFLVSGVNGFIGSHIAERLLKAGHRVRGLVRKTSNLNLIKGLEIKLFYGDITDRNSLDIAMKDVDIVVHVAGFASDWGAYNKFFSVNVSGTQNIAESANANNVKRFVHISSAAVCGFAGFRNIDESFSMPKTIFPYCETKKIAEQWLFNFAKSTTMEITAIRPGNVFGPKDHTFIKKYLDALMLRKIGYINGGKHWTCPIFIDNLVESIFNACFEASANGENFFLTDGLEIDWKTFTNKFADELGIKRPWLSIPFRLGYSVSFLMEKIYTLLRISSPPLLTRYRISNGGRDYHFSIEKAKRLLKFKPAVDFENAVIKTVAWYQQQRIT